MKFYNITALLYFDQINAALKLSIRDLKEKNLKQINALILNYWFFLCGYFAYFTITLNAELNKSI